MRSLLVAAAAFLVCFSAYCESPAVSSNPRELGLVVLRELSISGRTLAFRIDSNGCTDKRSLRVSVERGASLSAGVPHYRLAIERIAIDECKAMLWDGIVIELDVEKDLELSGVFTISVENPVLFTAGAKQ